ncbi:MAG: lamin tail domain-containing protein [Candidatus Saccharimonas sp.]|nr:lamin tail domain-containing protein [Candidatus Saccharimonas sp.]
MGTRAVIRGAAMIACGLIATILFMPVRTFAVSQSVAIRSVIAADTIDTNSELIEIENVSALPIDVTNWTFTYISSTNSTSSLHTIRSKIDGSHVFLPAGARETFFSTKYVALHQAADNYLGAETFTGKIGYSMAGLELRDNDGNAVDTVRWGGWLYTIDASPAPALSATTLLQRNGPDTDNNRNDFNILPQAGQLFGYGTLYEVADVCANIEGLQAEIPIGMISDGEVGCMSADTCPNIGGIQYEIPTGYELYNGECMPKFIPAMLFITEALPNPGGIDEGNEYIELYNDSDNAVDLSGYHLLIAGKRAVFPTGAFISPKSYKLFSDHELMVVLPNATGVPISLVARNDILVDQTPAYVNAPIDTAWALVNDSWQFTNQPTPDAANLPSLLDDGELPTPEPGLVACAEGYYRNSLTNRCNKIRTDELQVACKPTQYRSEETGRCRNYVTVATPVACKDGQYRSEETGRCRSIALAAMSLKPCGDDQFRNPATGRCKQIASTDDLPKPCASGYERNPDTNRCRKIQSTSIPLAAYPVEPIKPTGISIGVWLTAGGVIACGLGYAAWEWRRELAAATTRVIGYLGKK